MKYTDPDGRYTWAQFKSDINFAIKTDFDFGYDCTQYAAAAWNNGDYLNFAGWEITATLEMGFDLLACGFTKMAGWSYQVWCKDFIELCSRRNTPYK